LLDAQSNTIIKDAADRGIIAIATSAIALMTDNL